MYSLSYEMMIQVLRQLGSSGEFYADIPAQGALKEGGRVVLQVQSGNVVFCLIFNRSGKKLYHNGDAERLLPKLGILDWKLAPPTQNTFVRDAKSVPPVVPEAKPVGRIRDLIPKRRMVPEAMMRTWPTLERSIYSLADGTRTVEQIAKLLSRPTEAVEQVVHTFEITGVIEWRRR
jgi:hypothetical protein